MITGYQHILEFYVPVIIGVSVYGSCVHLVFSLLIPISCGTRCVMRRQFPIHNNFHDVTLLQLPLVTTVERNYFPN